MKIVNTNQLLLTTKGKLMLSGDEIATVMETTVTHMQLEGFGNVATKKKHQLNLCYIDEQGMIAVVQQASDIDEIPDGTLLYAVDPTHFSETDTRIEVVYLAAETEAFFDEAQPFEEQRVNA